MKNKVKNKNKLLKVLAVTLVVCMSFSMCVGFTYAPETETKIDMCDDCVSDMTIDDGENIPVASLPCDDCGCGGDSIYCEDCSCSGVATVDEDVDSDPDDEYPTIEGGDIDTIFYDLGLAVYTYDTTDISEDDDYVQEIYSPTIEPDGEVTISASVEFTSEAAGYVGYMQIYYLGPDDDTFSAYLTTPQTIASSIVAGTTYTGSKTFTDLEAGMHKIIFMFYTSNDDVMPVYTTASTVIVSGNITEISTISNVTAVEYADTDISFTHSTNGDLGTLTYIWYVNNSPTYVTEDPEVTINDLSAGIYNVFCQIVQEVGVAATTNSFTVTMTAEASVGGATIISQPSNVQVTAGETAVLSVSIALEDDMEASYDWYIQDSYIEDYNSPVIAFSDLPVGEYSVYCVITVDDEDYTTSAAVISVIEETVSDTDTDTDDDVVVEDEESWLTQASDWYEENQTTALVLGILGVIAIIAIAKKFKK